MNFKPQAIRIYKLLQLRLRMKLQFCVSGRGGLGLLRDLVLNYSILVLFVFLIAPQFIYAGMRNAPNFRDKLYIGIVHGGLAIVLFVFSVNMGNCMKLNFSEIAILLAAFFGGPVASIVVEMMMFGWRYAFEGNAIVIPFLFGGTAVLVTGILFTLIRRYWMKWAVGILFMLNSYYVFVWLNGKEIAGNSMMIYFLLHLSCASSVALLLGYLIRTRNYIRNTNEIERELLDMLRMQPGLTFKFLKRRESYVYVLLEGELVHRLGVKPEEIIGKSIDEIVGIPEAFNALLKEQYDLAWQGHRLQYEMEAGDYQVLVTLQPIVEHGEVIAVIGCGADISDLKAAERKIRASEELYRTIIESSQDFIVGLDERGIVTSANQALSRCIGLPLESIVGNLLKETLNFENGEQWESRFLEAVRTHDVQKFEMKLIVRQNHVREYHVTISPVCAGELFVSAKYIVTLHDITDLKMRQASEEANQAKSLFLARMSHDIRTPLNGIIGLASLLQKTPLSGNQQDYLRKIHSSSQALLGVINDILDLSKIEAGKMVLEETNFEPEKLFRRLADTLSVSIRSGKLEVIFDTDPDLPRLLVGDPYRLEQVLMNLLHNAIKFTEQGYVLFQVRLDHLDPHRSLVSFSVKDTGIGMTPEQCSVLFGPYIQANASTSRNYGGTGLGLSISKHLVETLGGRLQVESSVPGGSRFYFSIWLNRSSLNITPGVAWQKEARVLIAINNRLLRENITDMVHSLPLHIRVSACSYDEITGDDERELAAGAFDLMIGDMELEEMPSKEAADRLVQAARTGKAKWIALTTVYGVEAMRWKLSPLEADFLLTKPVCRPSLYEAIEFLLGQGSGQNVELEDDLPNAAEAKGNILVAEDHEINQLVIQGLLQRRGYSVTFANNGMEVLSLLQQTSWDAILLDLHMPELDGFQTAQRIRLNRQFDRIPIIALTANVFKEDHERCLALGMNDILTKPVDDERLFQTIDNWIGLKCLKSVNGIEMEQAIVQLAGKAYILQAVLGKFCQEYRGFSDKIQNEYRKDDMAPVRRMTHSLKGVAAHLYAIPLRQAATKLEQAMLEGTPLEAWEQELSDVQREIDSIARTVSWA